MLASDMGAQLGAASFIVDAELVAVDRADSNRLRAFQELSTRARQDVQEADVSVHVCVFLFDLLALDGQSVLHESLRQRRRRLRTAMPALRPGWVELAECVELHVPASSADGTAASAAGMSEAVNVSDRADTRASSCESSRSDSDGDGATTHRPRAAGSDQTGPTPKETIDGACARSEADAAAQRTGAALDANDEPFETPADGASLAGGTDTAEALGIDSAGWRVLRVLPGRTETVLRSHLLHAVAAGAEGLMLKALDERSAYEPSKRSDSWLKLKKARAPGQHAS